MFELGSVCYWDGLFLVEGGFYVLGVVFVSRGGFFFWEGGDIFALGTVCDSYGLFCLGEGSSICVRYGL